MQSTAPNISIGASDILRTGGLLALTRNETTASDYHLFLAALLHYPTLQDIFNTPPRPIKELAEAKELVGNQLLGHDEELPMASEELNRVIRLVLVHAQKTGLISEMDIVTALLEQPSVTLDEFIQAQHFKPRLLKDLVQERATQPDPKPPKPHPEPESGIDSYLQNLNEKAKRGEIMPLTCREKIIRRILGGLSQFKKKNVLLVGQPGVGKTALAEEVARLIVVGQVPNQLRDCTVYLLDTGGLVAGTIYRGQFERRMKALIQFLKEDPRRIVFIDEVHTILYAGASINGLTAGNLLKPPLARGEFRCIAATTVEEAEVIQKDGALDRRFQVIQVPVPTLKETHKILERSMAQFGQHYGLRYTPGCLRAILDIGEKYYPQYFNPDKTLSFLDSLSSYASYDLGRSVATARITYDYAQLITGKNTPGQLPIADITQRLLKEYGAQAGLIPPLVEEMQRCNLQLKDAHKPLALLLAGPDTQAQSDFARILAEEIYQDPNQVLTLNMEEFMESSSVNRIIGTPPGWQGCTAPTVFDPLRQNPHCLVFIEHLEKAHPDVLTHLQTILAKGQLTDMRRKVIPFAHCVMLLSTDTGNDHPRTVGFTHGATRERNTSVDEWQERLRQKLPRRLLTTTRLLVLNHPTDDVLSRRVEEKLKHLRTQLYRKRVTLKYSGTSVQTIIQALRKQGDVGYTSLDQYFHEEIEPRILRSITNGKSSIVDLDS